MAQPREAQPKPSSPEATPVERRASAQPADASAALELSDEDLEAVVGGVSAEAHQFLQAGLTDE